MSDHLKFEQEPHPTNAREVRYSIRNAYDQEPGPFGYIELVGSIPSTAFYQLRMERGMTLSDIDMQDIAAVRDTATRMYRMLAGAWQATEQRAA